MPGNAFDHTAVRQETLSCQVVEFIYIKLGEAPLL